MGIYIYNKGAKVWVHINFALKLTLLKFFITL